MTSERVKTYRVTVRNYGNPIHFRIGATSKSKAMALVMKAERCPRCAIMSVEQIKP